MVGIFQAVPLRPLRKVAKVSAGLIIIQGFFLKKRNLSTDLIPKFDKLRLDTSRIIGSKHFRVLCLCSSGFFKTKARSLSF